MQKSPTFPPNFILKGTIDGTGKSNQNYKLPTSKLNLSTVTSTRLQWRRKRKTQLNHRKLGK